MRCTSCGNEIPDNAKFCGMCGAGQEAKDSAYYVQEARRKQQRSGRKKWVAAVCGIVIAAAVTAAGVRFLGGKDPENYVSYVKSNGQLGTIDHTKNKMKAVHYESGDVLSISWKDWWQDWDLQEIADDNTWEKMFGSSGTTQMSADGKYISYASKAEGGHLYQLEVRRVGKAEKEAVVIGSDVVMHRFLSNNKIVWLKGRNGGLYISDVKGKAEKIAEGAGHFPFMIDEKEEHILWQTGNPPEEKGEIWTRSLDLKEDAQKRAWDSIAYLSADLKTILVLKGDESALWAMEDFGEEKLLMEGIGRSCSVTLPGPGGEYKVVGEDGEFFCGVSDWEENGLYSSAYDIYKYKDGTLETVLEDSDLIASKGDMMIYQRWEGEWNDEGKTTYFWRDGTEILLEDIRAKEIWFSKDGSKCWVSGDGNNKSDMLMEFETDNPGGTKRILSEKMIAVLDIGDEDIYYLAEDDGNEYEAHLYSGTGLVDYAGTFGFFGRDGTYYYRVGQDIMFTLKNYDGKESKIVAENIIEAKALADGKIAVLAIEDYNTESGKLEIYAEDGELLYTEEDVAYIMDADYTVKSALP